jgi:hypothetical protein
VCLTLPSQKLVLLPTNTEWGITLSTPTMNGKGNKWSAMFVIPACKPEVSLNINEPKKE